MITLPVRRLVAFVSALLLLAVASHAQRMELAATAAGEQPVVVESATISTEVTGRIAVTTFDLVFKNPNPRVLEGTFVLPLLDGQRVVRFALDIGGRLREAVPVEKVKARAVFEEIERRQVDPGLLEQTEGNTYRARVYPIPARGTRRLVIAYQEDIARDPAGVARHRLALNFAPKLARFDLTVRVHTGTGAAPVARTTLPLELPAWENQTVLHIERTDFDARGVLELDLPAVARPSVITERVAATGNNGAGVDADTFFYAELPVGALAAPTRPAPKQIGLLWDASGSGAARDHAKEFALLDAWFAAVREVDVTLVRLRDTAETPEKFTIKAGDWKKLRAALERTAYDGASSLDGWKPDAASAAAAPAVDEWLLFSDGLFNYGAPVAVAALPGVKVLHTINAGATADPDRLRGLAARNYGEFVDLLALTPADAAARLRTATPRVLDVVLPPGAFAEVFPEAGAAVDGALLIVTGRVRAPEATLTVRIGATDADAREFPLTVRRNENPGTLAARAWATAKIAALSADYERNREDIRRTSVAFGVVTRDTSLIVLETVWDYVRYDIQPPEELRAEWAAKRGAIVAERKEDTDDHLAEVVEYFTERREWWAKEFPKGKAPKRTDEDKAGGGSLGSGLRGLLGRGDGAPASAPAPRPAPATTGLGAASGGMAAASAAAPAEVVMLEAFSVASAGPTVALKPWEPKAGYLDRLKRAAEKRRYDIYIEERATHLRQPGFFVDVADFFFAQKDEPTALRVLSNLAEIGFEDTPMLRLLGRRIVQAGRADLARPVFERVLAIRPDEPQSYRDLALVCAALKDEQRAVDLFIEVITRPWSDRFPDIEQVALGELNALIATCGKTLDLSRVDPRLRANLPVDLRVVLTWDANDCDIDLWVTDPNGEKTFYSAPLSYQGGRMSRDFTGGYGPEEFLLKVAKPGVYKIEINYYGDRRQSALGPVTAQARAITGFGRADAREQVMTVRLSDNKETLEIGRVTITGK